MQLKSAINSGALSDANQQLIQYYQPDKLLDLVIDIFNALKGLIGDVRNMNGLADTYHGPNLDPPGAPAPQPVYSGSQALSNISVIPLPSSETRGAEVINSARRRQLLQAVTGSRTSAYGPAMSELPDSFTPRQASSLPPVRLPTCWHIMMYRSAPGGAYGPPGVDQALAMVQRALDGANTRLTPSGFQLFIQTDDDGTPCVRSDPQKNPYLINKPDGSGERDRSEWWVLCTSPSPSLRPCMHACGFAVLGPRSVWHEERLHGACMGSQLHVWAGRSAGSSAPACMQVGFPCRACSCLLHLGLSVCLPMLPGMHVVRCCGSMHVGLAARTATATSTTSAVTSFPTPCTTSRAPSTSLLRARCRPQTGKSLWQHAGMGGVAKALGLLLSGV